MVETKRLGRGRPRKEDPATNESIRFTKAQKAEIKKWQAKHNLTTFAGTVHALIARGLGE